METKRSAKKELVLKGRAASHYVAKGPARVIDGEAALKQVKEGEILVLIDSTPVMVPYIVKAAGYVGSRGGLLCHLAIVSREFEKACVNGIKEATKLIKNGEIVEVNGITGVVKVLRK